MDKVKQAIAWAKKNRFWLGSALVAISMLGCWFVVAGMIDAKTQKHTGEIKTKITQVNGIMNVSAEEEVKAHPNTSTEEGMRELLRQSADEIVEAWKLRYNAQAKILKWPKEILADKRFTDHFDYHNPPETYPGESERGIEHFSNFYLGQIPRQMERICKDILRTKWEFDPRYKKEDYKLTSEEELSRFAVVWDSANQELWNSKLTRFEGYDDHGGTMKGPTGLQIYMLQQDLWLLEAMFSVILEINGDVSANDLAKIKRIDHVAFGREARTKLGKLTPVELAVLQSSSDGMSGMPGGEAMFDRGGMGGGPEGEGSEEFDSSASRKPFHGRYVGADFNPIPADTVLKVLQAVKTGEVLPDSNLELIVSKRVPVRIALRMDEREIPNFMRACADSPFAFEINQVRKNRHVPGEGIALNGGRGDAGGMRGGSREGGARGGGGKGGSLAGGGGSRGGESFGNAGGPGGLGGMGGIGGDGGSRGSSLDSSKAIETRTNYDVDVEFYGIVKIYNPVSEAYFRKLIEGGDGQASLVKPQTDWMFADRRLTGR